MIFFITEAQRRQNGDKTKKDENTTNDWFSFFLVLLLTAGLALQSNI
jgi:hypothetical protein